MKDEATKKRKGLPLDTHEKYRERILAKARLLFAERGVDMVSMHQIAQAAGVGQGTLYRRYAHKGSLCEDLLGEDVRQFQQEIEQYLITNDEKTALQKAEQILVRLMCFNEKHADLLGAMVDAAIGNRRFSFSDNSFYRWLRQTLAVLLEQAKVSREVGAIDANYTAYVLLAPLVIDLYLHQRHVLSVSAEQMAESMRLLLFEGLSRI